jgi:hypothetical protein
MSKSDIKLTPHSHGELLEEVVRAYLHTGNPSCLVSRVLSGIQKYRGDRLYTSKEDAHVYDMLIAKLEQVSDSMTLCEAEVYNKT